MLLIWGGKAQFMQPIGWRVNENA